MANICDTSLSFIQACAGSGQYITRLYCTTDWGGCRLSTSELYLVTR